MRNLRFDDPLADSRPLFETNWEDDQKYRMNPGIVTALLREQVPVLEFVNWSLESIGLGSARALLPLNAPSTNQHFTHQAALFVLAADYTGGTALASLLHGWPVVGVHPVKSPQSASLWLLRVETKFNRPSVGDLTVSAVVDESVRQRIQKRFLAGQAVIETIRIEFRNGDAVVGESQLTYFARRSDRLRTEGVDSGKVNSLYELKLTSSAELIAGVRALESGDRFDDPFAAQMAGKHGMALAARFCQRTPQLRKMVAARTWHGDSVIRNFLAGGGRDIALLGVGWDMRAFRLPMPSGVRVFELDFPTTLAERAKRIVEIGATTSTGVERFQIPIDVRTMSLEGALQPFIDVARPLLVIWEGMSMYFQADEVRRTLEGIRSVLTHPHSLLWMDFVNEQAIASPHQLGASAERFIRGMQILGEPFTYGCADAVELLKDAGLTSQEVVSSNLCVAGRNDPIYAAYQFAVASSNQSVKPTTFSPMRKRRQMHRLSRTRTFAIDEPSQGAATRPTRPSRNNITH